MNQRIDLVSLRGRCQIAGAVFGEIANDVPKLYWYLQGICRTWIFLQIPCCNNILLKVTSTMLVPPDILLMCHQVENGFRVVRLSFS